MRKAILINKFKELDKEKRDLIKSVTPDDNKTSLMTKDQIVGFLTSDGNKKVNDAITRTDAYAEIENNIPDLGIAKLIIVSNIISPNDMVNVTINYELPKINLPLSIKQKILDDIKSHMSEEYDFERRQYDIVETALFNKGAFCQLIIPHEEYMQQTGRINTKTEADITYKYSKDVKLGSITLTTDINAINTDRDKDSNGIRELFKSEADSDSKIVDKLVDILLTADPKKPVEEFVSLSTVTGTKGRPAVMDLPFECVIPIIDTSAPELHYGYFIMLDERGNPLSKYSYNSYTNNETMARLLNSGVTDLNPRTANNVMLGDKRNLDMATHEPLNFEVFRTSIEAKIKENLKDLLNGEEVSSGDLDIMMKTMLCRSLAHKETKVLYVPETMLAYYAFEYGDDGVGVSIYNGISDLLSMKKYLLVVTYLSYLERLIPITKINVNLDGIPANNIEKYLAETKNVVLQNKLNPFINLGTNPYDMTELIRQHSIVINPEHSDLSLPQIEMDTEQKDMPEVDEELIKLIDNAIYNRLGILASVVQDGYENEYAILVSGKQKIIGKISNSRANIHMGNMSDHVRKVILNDGRLNEKIRNTILQDYDSVVLNLYGGDVKAAKNFKSRFKKEAILDSIMRKLILDIKAVLPTPVSETDDEQTERLENYVDAIDKMIEVTMSQDAYPETIFGENTGEIMENLGNMIKSKLILEKMRTMPYYETIVKYIDDLLKGDNKDEVTKYVATIRDLLHNKLLPTYALFKKKSTKADENYERLSGEEDEDDDRDNDNDNDDNDNDDNNNDGADAGGDDGGDDDFGVEIDDIDGEDGEEGEEGEEPEEEEEEEDEDDDDE